MKIRAFNLNKYSFCYPAKPENGEHIYTQKKGNERHTKGDYFFIK